MKTAATPGVPSNVTPAGRAFPRDDLSSQRCAGGETLAQPGDPGAELELVLIELDFCLLERGGTRATLNETAELDEIH